MSSNNNIMTTMSSSIIPCGPASRNKQPILDAIKPILDQIYTSSTKSKSDSSTMMMNTLNVLEIAAGTGEHGSFFKKALPYLSYLPTEPDINCHESILAWSRELQVPIESPIAFDVNSIGSSEIINNPSSTMAELNLQKLPTTFTIGTDAIICINMIHISAFQSTYSLFKLGQLIIKSGGVICLYGPYKVGGAMVESNIDFDLSLKSRNPEWGIRDLEEVQRIALTYGFELEKTVPMPANNLTVIFRKRQMIGI